MLTARLPHLGAAEKPAAAFQSTWDQSFDRVWLGPEYWANPHQDWRLADGRIECVAAAPDRNVHVLTRQLSGQVGTLDVRVRLGRVGGRLAGKGSAGFRVGILGSLVDYPELHEYRNNLWPRPGAGFNAGFNADGRLFLGRLEGANTVKLDLNRESLDLHLTLQPMGDGYVVTLRALDSANGQTLAQVTANGVEGGRLVGNIALVCNFPGGNAAIQEKAKAKANGKGAGKAKSAAVDPKAPVVDEAMGLFWFRDWRLSGTKLVGSDSQAFGPILWSQYTLHEGVLRLSAQMPPIGSQDTNTVRLQLNDGAGWKTVREEKIHPEARLAVFQVERWDATKGTPYRLLYTFKNRSGSAEHEWTGTVRRDPVDQDVLTVGDVSCNIHTIFPNVPLVQNMTKLNPDLLAFVGDQFYENCGGYGVQRAPHDKAVLDYLRKWYHHGWTWRELMRDRPSISLPDDHDVYQGNLFGEGGIGQTTTQEAGGYNLPAEWVNIVHHTQTAHHPAPYDPAPSERGTINYYGPLTYGRVSFALLADRQYKSGPEGKVPPTGGRGDHVRIPDYDVKKADVAGLVLLGAKQEQFLRDWALEWRGTDMKAVISQTLFTAMATTHGGTHDVLLADCDANGWPQTPRNRALLEIRKAFAFHLAGDQHLPAVVQYGIDEHGDGPVAFAGPAVNVGYPRWWEPTKTGRNKKTKNQKLTGEFLDHFGHPLTVLAFKNGPYVPPQPIMESVNAKTSGLGLVRFQKSKRLITIECWPYSADVMQPGTQMATWPVTVSQLDNYGRKATVHLPTLTISGVKNPVLQVIAEENNELLYILRVNGQAFRPHAFRAGRYTVKVSEPETGKMKTLNGLDASAGNATSVTINV